MDRISRFRILLSSGSPRRKYLLETAGYQIRVKASNVDESFPEHLHADDVPTFLSNLKAQASLKYLEKGEIILAADSIVILGDQIMGKPKNRTDAQRILSSLSAKTHRVVTGVTLLTNAQNHTWRTTSHVHFHPLTAEEISYYIDTFKPYDKAGSYGIQDWIGACKVQGIDGSYSNIMGLPMSEVYHRLLQYF